MPCLDAAPDAGAVRAVAHRRVHLRQRAEALVAVRRLEREMMRGRLDRGDVLVLGEELHLLRGRDVQHVHALAGLAREPHQALRASQCRRFVAPDRMRARIALDAQVLALVEAVFVLGMERGAPADRLEDVAHAVVVLDQQRAGGGAHEHLHAGTSGQALELGQLLGVLARAAHEEGEIAVHAVMGARRPCRQAPRRWWSTDWCSASRTPP